MNIADAINIAKQGKPVTRIMWKGTREMVMAGNRIVFLEIDGENKWMKTCLLDTYDLMANDWVLGRNTNLYGRKFN